MQHLIIKSVLAFLGLLVSSFGYANSQIEHKIRVGFIVDASASILDSLGRDKLKRAMRLSNEKTYNPIGIELVTSFVRNKNTNVQYTVNTTADVIAQALHDAQGDLDIINDTQTDILFYIAPSLPNNACGSAQIPTLVEHFDLRLLLGVIEQGFCINHDVLSHEIGHLFGAHHDEQNINSRLRLSPTAIACLKGEHGGSIMSYANLRSTVFSSQAFCESSGYDNEGLVKANAPLVASLYERNITNHTASPENSADVTGGGGGGGGGGSVYPIFLSLALLLACVRWFRCLTSASTRF